MKPRSHAHVRSEHLRTCCSLGSYCSEYGPQRNKLGIVCFPFPKTQGGGALTKEGLRCRVAKKSHRCAHAPTRPCGTVLMRIFFFGQLAPTGSNQVCPDVGGLRNRTQREHSDRMGEDQRAQRDSHTVHGQFTHPPGTPA